MPTVPDIPGPYRLFFYSFDCHEPPHVHMRRERMVCKFWLTPVALSVNHDFSPRELNRIRGHWSRRPIASARASLPLPAAAQAWRSAAFGNHPEHGTFCVLATCAL